MGPVVDRSIATGMHHWHRRRDLAACTMFGRFEPRASGSFPGIPGFPQSMATSGDAPQSFEAALTELEQIVATMEQGQLTLTESLAAYKRGASLLHYCQTVLKDAQQQVEVLEK